MIKYVLAVALAGACLYNTATSQNTHSPTITIAGIVHNPTGEPLAGATITNTRCNKGTVTNASGVFKLADVSIGDQLRIGYIGYAAQEVTINKAAPIAITLKDATNELDKVVVQAYGTTSQRLATGNIGVVRADDIARQPVMNPLQALQGLVPGVVVTSTSGYANGPVKVEIRGRNSINEKFTSDPLYVIDGVPLTILDLMQQDSYNAGSKGAIQSGVVSPANGQSPFFNINPEDIESVEILKDADATALYGSRGANGVILITTKKGKAGKTAVDAKVTSGYSQVPRFNKMLNTQQYIMLRREALKNDGLTPSVNNAADLLVWDTTRFTDWQKYLWGGTGKNTDVEMGISGGNGQTSFRTGVNYHYQADLIAKSGSYQRGGAMTNISHRSTNNKFSVSFNSLFSKTVSDMRFIPGVITNPPNAPDVYDKDGKLNFAGWAPLTNLYSFGPLLQSYKSTTNFLNNGIQLSYLLFSGFSLKTSAGYSFGRTEQFSKIPVASQDPARNPKGSSEVGNSFFENIIAEPQIEYMRLIGKGKLTTLLGGSFQNNNTRSTRLSGRGFTRDANLDNVGTAPATSVSNIESQYKYIAVFGRLNYLLKNRYIFNLNVRRDGSSRFGPGHRFGNFGSIGGAWIFSDEKWMQQHLPFMSFGKLRASYGLTGSDPMYNYQYLSKWIFVDAAYNNVQPLLPVNHTDSLLHWQVNKKAELALDLGFFKDALHISASWYSNRSNDQIVPFPTPVFTGFESVTSNSPANVRNSGWEFSVRGTIVDRKKVSWESIFNIGINRNKLLSYPNLDQSPYAGLYVVGRSLNIVKLLHNTGVDPQTGLYTFEDFNGDGAISIDYSGKTVDDKKVVDLSTKYEGSFVNNLNLGSWQLSVSLYFRRQTIVNPLYSLSAKGGGIFNQTTDLIDRWQKPGDIATVAKLTTNPGSDKSYRYFGTSDAIYSDVPFVRLQNLYISYRPSWGIFKNGGLKGSSLFVQGQNLFLLTKYKGLDPEVPGFGSMPRLRTITAGITIKL